MSGTTERGALATLRGIAREPAAVAAEWKARGGKVLGFRCLYVPEEIIWAAGMLPYPLYGTPEPVRLADAYFQSCTCEFVRNVFDQALEHRLDMLDGLALCNTCDVVRRLCDIWAAYVPDVPVYMVNNPQRLLNPSNHDFYLTELRAFRAHVERLAGTKVTDAKLRDAIGAYNETRSLLREVYALREGDVPGITGPEAFEVSLAVSVLPRDRAAALLRELLEELRDREPPERSGPRILVTGSILDHPALLEMIEEEGAQVVVEDLCNTTRGFWHLVDRDAGDPLEALYRHHDRRPYCACMHPTEARLEYVLDLAKTFRAEAVIDFNLKYCHPFLYEAPLLRKALEARGLRTNVLEIGHDLSGHGQLRTRIQAFVEMLEL
jgi:benzoyl-CoA reductase subunit C